MLYVKSIYILGINPGIPYFSSHDPSACLIHNGKIIAAAEEERFIRIKHAVGRFPINAIRFCLDFAGIHLDDLTSISLPCDPGMCKTNFRRNFTNPIRIAGKLIGVYHSLNNFRSVGFYNKQKIADNIKSAVYGYLGSFSNNPSRIKIDFVSHHRAHAASTFYCSGFKKASVLTIDGVGEQGLGETTVLWEGNNKNLIKIKSFLFPNSLGVYYELFCQYIGFTLLDGPGKVMGLSSYGRPSNIDSIFEKKLKTKNTYDITNFMSRIQIRGVFGKRRKIEDALKDKSKNVAYTVQKKLEEQSLKLVSENYENTGSTNLCLAGGVTMNCVMNGELLRSENVNNIFIQPGATDLGLAIGTALETYRKLGYNAHTEFKHNYLGPKYNNDEIVLTLKDKRFKNKISYDYYKDIAGVTAELLSKNKLVGWFQGRMELGARALGCRSILANPVKANAKDILNAKVKHREMWRPFCPSLLDRAHSEYVEDAYPSPYMILAFNIKKEKQKEIPAVTHVDGTARTQTVTKDTNPLYFKMIQNFESETGVPVVLNTSFNVAGEPIVCRPEEAINDLLNTELDCLAIGGYLVTKKN